MVSEGGSITCTTYFWLGRDAGFALAALLLVGLLVTSLSCLIGCVQAEEDSAGRENDPREPTRSNVVDRTERTT